ncbi:MAG: enoyl-CoA hydratase/isomerase family protein [Bacteroidota bacterium]
MEHLVVKKTEAIVSIQLNRPEVLNAFNEAMLEELYQVLQDIEKDPTLKVMILSGMGRAFSAGVDLKSTTADGFQQGGSFMELGLAVGNLLANMSKVSIAQVHGYCFTGALELMLFLDLAFCGEDTQFGDTHAKWAVMPRWGMTQRLARRVGLVKAKELTFRAMRIKGKEAERIGLVNRAFPEATLEEEVNQIAAEIVGNSFEAIQAIKELYNRGYETTLKEGLRIEYEADSKLSDTSAQLSQFQEKKFSGD